MKFALVSFLTLCVSVVTFAQNPMNAGIASTHPPLNSVVARSFEYTIRWGITDENAKFIDTISVIKGEALALDVIIPNILTNASIAISDLSYNWTIPATLTPGADYSLRFIGDNSDTTYPPYFSIKQFGPVH
ncbi:hypothetical protein HPULCUR_010086 [Helicostylum pulchrum]|uniref:Yeast cell wall synthesis Kre9/Knh1-like N-terminal domain-containing protein n=1 Tax=Helicostylum pulchrum TaxID=562976 RepID=A0ABP9YC98_9FUNG